LIEVVYALHLALSGDAKKLAVNGSKIPSEIVLSRGKSEPDLPNLFSKELVQQFVARKQHIIAIHYDVRHSIGPNGLTMLTFGGAPLRQIHPPGQGPAVACQIYDTQKWKRQRVAHRLTLARNNLAGQGFRISNLPLAEGGLCEAKPIGILDPLQSKECRIPLQTVRRGGVVYGGHQSKLCWLPVDHLLHAGSKIGFQHG